MKTLCVLGFGRFGELAVRRLQNQKGRAAIKIQVIDNDPDRCREAENLGAAAIFEDAVAFLLRHIERTPPPDWVVPAVPIHVAWRWVRGKIEQDVGHAVENLPIPAECIAQLPNPMTGSAGQVYMSLADFICPDDCPEPAGICTVTGKKRPYSLFDKLAHLQGAGFRSIVIRSRQLAPGVGGYRPSDLYAALDRVQAHPGRILLSTACRCHGVMHAFEVPA